MSVANYCVGTKLLHYEAPQAQARPERFVLYRLNPYKAPQAQARPERLVLHLLKLQKAPQAKKTVSTTWLLASESGAFVFSPRTYFTGL